MEVKDWTNVSFEEGRLTLRQWREDHARRSEEIVELWEHVLSRSPNSLNDELWIIYEQVCIAALDCGRQDVAVECIAALEKQFRGSNRVMKLKAMEFESIGRYEDALHVYDKLIEATNAGFRKRKIAVLKVRGERGDAIRQLNEYLKVFLNDNEAWLELSQMYLREGDYSRAAHCIEELLVANPFNSLFFRRIADIRYSQGGVDNIELARTYFEKAGQLNHSDARSYYGVVMCCNSLLPKSSGNRKKELQNSAENALSQLEKIYQEPGNANVTLNRKVVEQLRKGITSC
ncbi:hypothetical protein L596_026072 [Steinernema carpocapsae]|uniref:ER membrane protein complex subunit 2 n=1 Tax=Steinernema carpocapsae TaxID=34508 RepID=A0A4V6XVP1_STECR|nr:hypothetical protein L596_026072 [Steinernema carpocapsae]